MNVANYLEVNAKKFPTRPAIMVGGNVTHTYSDLDIKSKKIGAYLRNKESLNEGDRVAVFLPNSAEYIELLFGIWYAGLVAVPINHKLSLPEVSYIIENSNARLLFSDEGGVAQEIEGTCVTTSKIPDDKLSDSLAHHHFRKSTDPAWIFYASGTTGKPKGATLSHLNLSSMSTSYLVGIESVESETKLAHFAPMSHGSGLYVLPFIMAGGCNLIPDPAKFTPENFISTVNNNKKISMFLAPTMVRRILDHLAKSKEELAIENLSTIIYGGGPMYSKDLDEAIDAFGYCLAQVYGQGESPMTITYLDKEQHKLLKPKLTEMGESENNILPVGQPHPQLEVAIREKDGTFLPEGQDGEVCVRGDIVMEGYWGNKTASEETLVDGWLRTGDIGHLDGQGYLYLTDRLKDVIISGGTNIYPREVEEILLQYPGVREVSVVGKRDPEWGEVVVAFISSTKTINEAEIDQFCVNNMARFKRPKIYIFMNDLPKNAYGKILKTELRKHL